MNIPFTKYQGAGNDFILIDDREMKYDALLSTRWIEMACDRHFGIGGDGLMLLQPGTDGADFFMKYYNSDGRTSTFCGNGGRCMVAFASDLGLHAGSCKFLGTDGWHYAEMKSHREVHLSMIDVEQIQQVGPDEFVLFTGSPHFVCMVDDPDTLDIVREGRAIRNSAAFLQEGINVNFVSVVRDGEIRLRTYERGVEDETLACGTGVVASAIAAATRLDSPKNDWLVHAAGGDLRVMFLREGQHTFTHVNLIGPALPVFSGAIPFV